MPSASISIVAYEQYRKTAVDMIMSAVKAADPTEAVTRNVRLAGDRLQICDLELSRSAIDRILLFSVGKASTPMASAFERVVRPDGGLAITKLGAEIDAVSLESIQVVRAYHPEPRAVNVEATE